MSVRNTNIQQVDLNKVIRSAIQTGTIPIGPTGVSSPDNKYSINLSTPILGNPRDNIGSNFKFPVERINQDYTIVLVGDWVNKLKPGDFIELIRGSLVRPYSIRKIFYDTVNDETVISLFVKREDPKDLEKFVDTLSFPIPSADTFIILNKVTENPNENLELLKSFEVKMIPSDTNSYSASVSWEIDPKVSVTRLRWRSIPNVSISSDLSFSILNIGEYTQVPKVSIISDTGYLAALDLSGSISQVNVSQPGSGYTFANIEVIGGGGSGAIITANIITGSITSFNVISGGSGYSSTPSIKITGDGSGATADTVLFIDTISNIEQGAGYLSVPQVIVDSTYLVGLTATEITASLLLKNKSKIEYIRIENEGSNYTDASVSITGSLSIDDATATAIIENGSVKSINIIYPGYDYSLGANVSIIPIGPSGSGATAIANIDLFSEWTYEEPLYFDRTKIINDLKTNVLYEIQILVSEDKFFRGILKYSNSYTFKLSK